MSSSECTAGREIVLDQRRAFVLQKAGHHQNARLDARRSAA